MPFYVSTGAGPLRYSRRIGAAHRAHIGRYRRPWYWAAGVFAIEVIGWVIAGAVLALGAVLWFLGWLVKMAVS